MNGTLVIVTLISAALAASMTVVALRMVWNERRRSAARVAALTADIHATDRGAAQWRGDESPIAIGEMFSTTEGPQRPWKLVLGVLGVGAALAIAVVMSLGTPTLSEKTTTPQGLAAEATVSQPLELLALEHERADDHLTVRGIVRNPEHAQEIDHLTAVVLLFNQQGGFLTSGRAAIETAALEPGAEATFVITVPGTADVGRYRVSFRTDDQLVPHVDRRQSGVGHKSDVKS